MTCQISQRSPSGRRFLAGLLLALAWRRLNPPIVTR